MGADRMKVVKCINNNVISCLDKDGHELIAMGKGLGFSLRPGDTVAEEKAEKIFRMQSREQFRQLTDLFSTLPPQQIELCSRIVDRAAEDLSLRLSPSIYITLTDHVCFAIERLQHGTVFQNTLLSEVRMFYPREYSLGKYALELIHQELDILFPDDEAANIALHLVNAEYENSISDTLRITQTLHDILASLTQWPRLNIDPESNFYDEFTVHLKFLVFRAFSHQLQQRTEERFVQSVKLCYPEEFFCAQQIAREIERRCGAELPAAEEAYLATSLRRACRGS